MELHVFPRYDSSGASSRIRMYEAKPYFARENLMLHFHPLLPKPYLRQKYAGEKIHPAWIAQRFVRRIETIRKILQKNSPWLWVEYELFPWLPAWAESWVFRKTRVILDFDDAVFHRYDHHPSRWIRKTLGSKICMLIRKAFAVTACNRYLEEYARRCGAHRVVRYPSSVDLKRYTPRPVHKPQDPMVVGWLGSPSTSWYLMDLLDVLRELKNEPIRWLFVGTDPRIQTHFAGLPVEFVDWSLEEEVSLLHRMDVGIMPLPDTPWTRGKCGFKLIQYMAVGIPVIASPVGINVELAQPWKTGFLATSPKEWVDALRTLLHDPELRRSLGAEGRKLVEERFDLEKNAMRLAQTFLQWMEEIRAMER